MMKIVQRSTSSEYTESALLVIAPKSWNSLPYEIICINSPSTNKYVFNITKPMYVMFLTISEIRCYQIPCVGS